MCTDTPPLVKIKVYTKESFHERWFSAPFIISENGLAKASCFHLDMAAKDGLELLILLP